MAEKRSRTERSESEMNTECGGEAVSSQFQFRCKKRLITNISLMDSDEETILYFVKYYEELYNRTNEHVKDNVQDMRDHRY